MSKHNPFTPGAGRRPPYLAGREAEQGQLTGMLNDMKESGEGQAIVLYGPRGMGKTVLLGWFERQCGQADIITIKRTPSTGLASLEDLPRSLLPKSRLPDEVSLGVKGVLSMEWKSPDAGSERDLRDHLIAACLEKPRALLLDEAHTLEADVCRSLLNIAQEVSNAAPFLLVMAGTPGLEPFLMSVGATFVERSRMMGVGRLDSQPAGDAVRIPLEDGGVAIDGGALARVVEDAQRYPYFLQLWGEALWDLAARRGLKALGATEVDAAMPSIARERSGFYRRRFHEIGRNGRLLHAAHAVACAFKGKAGLGEKAVWRTVYDSLGGAFNDADARWDEAVRLSEELNRRDFVWSPSGSAEVEPGIPSFMAHVRAEMELDQGPGL